MIYNCDSGVELVGKRYRNVCGSIFQVCFSLGAGLLGLVAYFVRDWRTLQFIIGLPIFACAILYWYLLDEHFKEPKLIF